MTGQPSIVNVSRPTFLELSNALGSAGHQNMFNEDGNIECGALVIHSDDLLPQRDRLAAAFDEAGRRDAVAGEHPDAIYDDGLIALYARSRYDGVHLTECRPGVDPTVVTVPHDALHLVSIDLIERIGRPPE